MKKLLFALTLLIALTANSQKQDSTKDAKDTAARLYTLSMPKENWEALLKLIQTADEKPSVLREWTALIINNTKEFIDPRKKVK